MATGFVAAPAARAQDEVPFVTSPEPVTLAMLSLARVGPRDLKLEQSFQMLHGELTHKGESRVVAARIEGTHLSLVPAGGHLRLALQGAQLRVIALGGAFGGLRAATFARSKGEACT